MHRTRSPPTPRTPLPFIFLKPQTGSLSSGPFLSKICFPAKHGAFPAFHCCRRSAFQPNTTPFQRPIFVEDRLYRPTATQATCPAAHFHRTSAFQRHGPPFQRPMFIARRLSSDTGHLSSGPFSSHVGFPATQATFPAAHFHRTSADWRQV